MESEKRVDPRGHILNDNDAGADYLGHTIYAEALTETIVNVETPVTIGVFARWGSGKSFLVKHVCNLLDKRQREKEAAVTEIKTPQGRTRCCCTFILLVVIASLLVTLALAATAPEAVYKHILKVTDAVFDESTTKPTLPDALEVKDNSTGLADEQQQASNLTLKSEKKTAKESTEYGVKVIRISSLVGMTFIVIVVFVVMCCVQDLRWPKFAHNFKLIAFAAFTKLPITHPGKTFVRVDDDAVNMQFDPSLEREAEKTSAVPKRYLFVNFSAWEYAGSDNLWAGIATNLSDTIESEFGSVISRLFRIFDLDEISQYDAVLSGNRENILYARFGTARTQVENRTIAGAYGAVIGMRKYDDFLADKQKKKKRKQKNGSHKFPGWWIVEYSDSMEAKSAQTYLKRYGVESQLTPPPRQSSGNTTANGSTPTAVIEMTNLHSNNESDELVSQANEEETHESNVNLRRGFCGHFFRYPKKKCHLPVLYWSILLILSAIVLPIITYEVAKQLSLTVFKSSRAVPVTVQIFAWLPGSAGAMYVIISFLWAMLHSQRSRIKSACSNESLSCALGMMGKIKYEVHVISKLLHCAEFTHGRRYTVVITIDDLDRVPQEKVKSVLEAVSILLSDGSSPFVCLIALDSRVAVKCIEEGMGKALLNANVNGHEYLKKIINLPFCLPEVTNDSKKKFIEGLIDQTDETSTIRRYISETGQIQHSRLDSNDNNTIKETMLCDGSQDTGIVQIDSGASHDQVDGGGLSTDRRTSQSTMTQGELSGKKFLFLCRRFLQSDPLIRQHLQGNPRNIKRIFNVLSLTSVIIKCTKREEHRRQILRDIGQSGALAYDNDLVGSLNTTDNLFAPHEEISRTSDLARDLVRWIVLTDQWPYRMSYILQVIDDADQRTRAGRSGEEISDQDSLFTIYQSRVRSEITESSDENKSLLSLDADPDIFYSFIKRLESVGMNKQKAKRLKKYTMNLDHSLRQPIGHQRGLADISSSNAKEQPTNDSTLNPSTSEKPEGIIHAMNGNFFGETGLVTIHTPEVLDRTPKPTQQGFLFPQQWQPLASPNLGTHLRYHASNEFNPQKVKPNGKTASLPVLNHELSNASM